jgi:hypothetical protein
VEFEAVAITEQRERWRAAGSPPVPTLVLGGVAHALQHPGHAAALLGLEPPAELRDAWSVAAEIDAVVDAWLELAAATPWQTLTAPGVVLARTPLALTVDALVGIAALTAALWTGWFHWPGNPETGATGDGEIGPYEASVVARIDTREDLLEFALRVARGWRAALAEHERTIRSDPARAMSTPRGELALVELLEAQRLHCAGHYRQATATPGVVGTLDLATLPGLVLAGSLV